MPASQHPGRVERCPLSVRSLLRHHHRIAPPRMTAGRPDRSPPRAGRPAASLASAPVPCAVGGCRRDAQPGFRPAIAAPSRASPARPAGCASPAIAGTDSRSAPPCPIRSPAPAPGRTPAAGPAPPARSGGSPPPRPAPAGTVRYAPAGTRSPGTGSPPRTR